MNKTTKHVSKFFVTLLAIALACSPLFAALSPAKQLEKGKQLFAQNKNDEAMEAFIEVLVNGSRAEVDEANKYINKIHNRVGGIQDPVDVSENFEEGAVSHAPVEITPEVAQKQLEAETAPIVEDVKDATSKAKADADAAALKAQQEAQALAQAQEEAAQALREKEAQLAAQAQQAQAEMEAAAQAKAADLEAAAAAQAEEAEEKATSTFTELTSPAALQARQVYSQQKLDSMQQAAIEKLSKEKGIRLYFRNGQPDAIDIDSDVLFDGYKFRQDAFPVLNEIYTLMALTQGAKYVILPPGSYTDNITLSGIRHAMALNSFFVHKGLSAGKISYNMGLYDQEPPAKFANLDGVSIVFDYDAELPASLPDATSVSKQPLLSMAVVPVSNKIDPSAGEAFAIDFSVIETENPIENWVFQVVQHGTMDTYYVVRQLEGFSPVYHQVLWNARKGIIGRELACGQYTLVLTATDVQGGKRTLRRQVEVACSAGQKTASKAAKSTSASTAKEGTLDYKTPRLWTKPGRVMKGTGAAVQEEPETAAYVDPLAAEPSAYANTDNQSAGNYGANPATGAQSQGVSPYDMPYDEN